MLARPALVVALVLVAVGGSAAAGVPALRRHADERDLIQTQAAAQQVTKPPNATFSSSCHGSGLIGCWTMPDPVDQVRDSVVGAWHPSTTPLEVAWHAISSLTSQPLSAPQDECSVGYRRHGRAAFVLLRPVIDQGNGRVTGTLVAIHDGSS